ncbi:MAG: lactate 2-monooxygenase [Nitrososphaerales archaeon]
MPAGAYKSRENYGGFGQEWQNAIYLGGLSSSTPKLPVEFELLEEKARAKLAPEAFDYAAGGAGGEGTMKLNLQAFSKYQIVPRVLRNVENRDTRVTLFGKVLPAPVILGPVGVLSIIHPEGELAVARASASLGLPFVLSSASSHSIEQVAEVMGDGQRWFQLYYGKDREINASLVSRAEKSGYSAIVVTLDTKILGWRERDLARAYLPFLKGEGIANYISDPVFRSKLPEPPEKDITSAILKYIGSALDPSFDWEDLRFLRDCTKLPIILKGVLHPDDAKKALDYGIAGIIVSNHGGRQVDGSVASLEALVEIRKALQDKIPILFDSGIRRGADIIKALALGASSVLIGRSYVWGLALGGEEGVKEVVSNLLADFDLTLALSGYTKVEDLNRDSLRFSS